VEREQPGGEHGAALLLALIAVALIAAVAGSLVVSTSADLVIAGNYRASIETAYVAEAAVERTIGALAAMADWGAVLTPPPANSIAPFDDGAAAAKAPDGRALSMPGADDGEAGGQRHQWTGRWSSGPTARVATVRARSHRSHPADWSDRAAWLRPRLGCGRWR
jgi:hypothetical protein